MRSAPVNWHLFDTIDIFKQATGTIEHRSTAPLNTTPPLRSPLCSEQFAVPGVPKPAALSDLVTWRLIEGTGSATSMSPDGQARAATASPRPSTSSPNSAKPTG